MKHYFFILLFLVSIRASAVDGIKILPFSCQLVVPLFAHSLSMDLTAEGKILLGLNSRNYSSVKECYEEEGIRTVRLLSDGKLDLSLNGSGILLTKATLEDALLTVIKSNENGSYQIFGARKYYTNDMFAFKFTLEGKIDKAYANQGRKFISWEEDPFLSDVALLKDGSSILVGQSGMGVNFGNPNWALVKLDPEGKIDFKFGKSGRVKLDFSGKKYEGAARVAVDAKSQLLVAGEVAGNQYRVIRLFPDGKLDTAFGNNGFLDPIARSRNPRSQDIKSLPDGSFLHLIWDDVLSGVRLTKYDSLGRVVNNFAQNGSFQFAVNSKTDGYSFEPRLLVTALGDIFIATEDSSGAEDSSFVLVIALDSSGRFNKNFANAGLLKISVRKITQSSQIALLGDDLYLAGRTGSVLNDMSFYISKFDLKGRMNVDFGK